MGYSYMPSGNPSHEESNQAQPPNFIVFGEMGSGKSSLINLIAGEKRAESSPDAQSCTLQSTKHEINLANPRLHVNLWDTVGLNEPSMNDSSYLDALVKAYQLIVSLEKAGGLHGLLYCIRGPRISNTMEQNYKLFYEFLCQSKVPLTLVFTGLENEKGNMDDWWMRNQAHVEQKCSIGSTRQVCITATTGLNNVFETRYSESRGKMLKVLSELMEDESHAVDVSNWFVRMCKALREFLAPSRSSSWSKRNSRPGRKEMKKMLTERCKLNEKDAAELLRRIKLDTEKEC